MKTKLVISQTAALSAIVLTTILFPAFAQAGGPIASPARAVVDDRGTASIPRTDPVLIPREVTKGIATPNALLRTDPVVPVPEVVKGVRMPTAAINGR